MKCPLCNHELEDVPFTVDLADNLIAYKDKSIQMFPRPTEVVKILLEYYPRFVSRDIILDRVWEQTEHNSPTFHNVYAQIVNARIGLKLLGCGIMNENKIGYRLVLADEKQEALPKVGKRVVLYNREN